MQPDKKMKALSVLSMAVAATLGAKAAHGAVLTMYYDNISATEAPNHTSVSTAQYNYSTAGGDYSLIPTSINMVVGGTFEFGIDAVVTGNVNPQAGQLQGQTATTSTHTSGATGHKTTTTSTTLSGGAVQPSYLGLATLNLTVPSNDSTASKLSPNHGYGGTPFQTVSGQPDYNSTASLNNLTNPGPGLTPQGSNNGATPAPNFSNGTPGDIWTPHTGPQTAGDVGDRFSIFQGNGSQANTNAGLANIAQYGSPTKSYGTATDFFDSLSYTAVATGTVTLSPYADANGESYWEVNVAGNSTTATSYIGTTFTNGGDSVGTLPVLVINITAVPAAPVTSQPIISLTASAPSSYGSSSGTVTVTGGHNYYTPGYLPISPAAATAYVQVNGFNPATDEELYALDVLVNGTEATSGQIAVLINAIDGGDGTPASTYTAVGNTWASLGLAGPNPFDNSLSVSPFNLFLDMGFGTASPDFFGWDASMSNDSNLVGYQIEEVAVVPEPMSLGLLALGGLGLMSRRHRKV